MSKRREFWKRLVREVEAGATIGAVAERRGVPPSTLSWWKWKLRSEAGLIGVGPSLLPVVVREQPVVMANHELELELGDVRMRVTVGTDPHYVAALVGALRSC